MHFAGTVEVNAPRGQVWDFLIDPTKVGSCGPGVESVEIVDDTHFKARAKVSVGPVSARFAVNLEMGEQAPPERATIIARGQAPGTAVDATATMTLRDGDGGPDTTVMDWVADVNVSGTIASLGMRLLEGTANKMIGQTFACIRSKLEGNVESPLDDPALARS
jgi:carbon monoxide dehydrogenase subunit G